MHTPRKVRSKFLRPVHSPSMVLVWTSPEPVPVLVLGPLLLAVVDRAVHPLAVRQAPVTGPLVGVAAGQGLGVLQHQRLKLLAGGAPADGQPHLPALPAHRAHYRRAVVGVSAVAFFLLARRRGGSQGSGWGLPFSPAFWNISSVSVTASGRAEAGRFS